MQDTGRFSPTATDKYQYFEQKDAYGQTTGYQAINKADPTDTKFIPAGSPEAQNIASGTT